MKTARQVKAVVAIPDPVDETALIDVWNALATLPDSLRSVVVLGYFEDLSSREIASVLRIPDGTVSALMLSYDLPGAGRRSNHLLTVVLANPAAYTAKPNDTRSKPVPHSDDVMITERVSEQWTVGGEVVLLVASEHDDRCGNCAHEACDECPLASSLVGFTRPIERAAWWHERRLAFGPRTL